MDLNLFNNLSNNKDKEIKIFIDELNEYIEKMSNNQINQDIQTNESIKNEENLVLEENENRKEGHLYLVTEDRDGEVYLWDYTQKSEIEFSEKGLPSEVLAFATEGAMLQFKEGKYILYSPNGYDIVENEENID